MKTLLVGARYRDLLEEPLLQRGFEAIWLPDNPALDPRLAGHADLSVFRYQRHIVAAAHLTENTHIVNYFTNKGFQVHEAQAQGKAYPEDVSLCAAVVGDKLIHKADVTDPEILQVFDGEVVSIRQGYARCMICTVGANAIITADHGVASAAAEHGIVVLEIPHGGFVLNGFKEGFIGGSTFTDNEANIVYFTGTLTNKAQEESIVDFLRSLDYEAVCLTNLPAFDIGGAILL